MKTTTNNQTGTTTSMIAAMTTDQLIARLGTRRFQLRTSRSFLHGNLRGRIETETRTIANELASRGLSSSSIAAIN